MALRNQPYLPLYVQDFMTDEKLSDCSMQSYGLYILLMCLMHKSETYGALELKNKYKKYDDDIKCFALMLTTKTPFLIDEIEVALQDLLENDVIQLTDGKLCQKRMIKDGELSDTRAEAGKIGGRQKQNDKQTDKQNDNKPQSKIESKTKANSEYEIEYENENEIRKIKNSQPAQPTLSLENYEPELSEKLTEWIEYRKEIKKQIKNQKQLDKFHAELLRLANDDLGVARQIIDQSIANGWQGAHALAPTTNNSRGSPPTRKSMVDVIADIERKRNEQKLKTGEIKNVIQ